MRPEQELLQRELGQRIEFRQKRSGVTQIIAPIFHEDGDMLDLFIDTREKDPDRIRLTDAGMTLMRLSYNFDVDTPNKQRLLDKILTENEVSFSSGEIYLDSKPEALGINFLHLSQVLAKVSSLQYLKRQIVSSLFYEQLEEFIKERLSGFRALQYISPIADRPELEADWTFPLPSKPIYLFGVKDSAKARLSAVACLEFQKRNIPFRSVIVHEDFETLAKKDQKILTNAADKQFVSLQDFIQGGEIFLQREAA